MAIINRAAVVVTPAQPFLDWLRRVDEANALLTLEDVERDPSIYLLPEWDTEDEAVEHLAQVSEAIFEEQLDAWHRVPSDWPRQRDVKALLEWFQCSFHTMIFDLSADPLEREDF